MPRSYGTTNAAPYAAAPAVGPAGDTYFNTGDKQVYVSDGTRWIVDGGTYGLAWTFDGASQVTNSVPSGVIRYNSATHSSTTFIGMGRTNTFGQDVTGMLQRLSRGSILIFRSPSGAISHAFSIAGSPTVGATSVEWNVNQLGVVGTMPNGLVQTDIAYDVRYTFIEDLADVGHSASVASAGQILVYTAGSWEAAAPVLSGTYTPTLVGMAVGTGGSALNTAYYVWDNGVLTLEGWIRFGTTTVTLPGTTITVALPGLAVFKDTTWNTFAPCGEFHCLNNAASANSTGTIVQNSNSAVRLLTINVAGTFTTRAATGATSPITWDNGSIISWKVRALTTSP